MLIAPVSYSSKIFNLGYNQYKNVARQVAYPKISVDCVHFTGKKSKDENALKNEYRILLTQDIWAEKLDVKMPENDTEKEVLLEVLMHRKNLDRYCHLTNDKTRLLFDISYYKSLMASNPSHPDLPIIARELQKRGNISAVLDTLNKNIDREVKKNRASIEYFNNIDKLNYEYLPGKRVTTNTLQKFWQQIVKNNINSKHEYSTQELIDIICGKKVIEPETKKVNSYAGLPVNISKKLLLANARNGYEQFLRENVNIYMGKSHGVTALKGKELVYNINEESIRKYPGIEKQIRKIFEEVQKKYHSNVSRLGEAEIYPVGTIWKDMEAGVETMKEQIKKINTIEEQLSITSENPELFEELNKAKSDLENVKKAWLEALQYSISYESANREKFKELGRVEAYDYLTSANKEISRYKELNSINNQNAGMLPEDIWDEILA